MSKTCIRCGTIKPLDQFYKCPRMKDGHFNKCIPCFAAYAKEDRTKRREFHIARERHLRQRPAVKAAELLKKKKQRLADPTKFRVYGVVRKALASGRLTRQPCEVCQTTVNVEAHHDDYSKPLDVRWLCFRHHRELHGQTILEEVV